MNMFMRMFRAFASWRCPNCGTLNASGDMCSNCGYRIGD